MNFDKYANDGHTFVKHLANEFNHPDEVNRAGIILESVLHALRDRISIEENFDVISQLPMFMKAIYVDEWKYRKNVDRLKSLQEFTQKVKEEQSKYGEKEFNWNESTEELIERTIGLISERYWSEGLINDIKANLPADIHKIFEKVETP
jgi:uncharacterized protein (DUF2267 family)